MPSNTEVRPSSSQNKYSLYQDPKFQEETNRLFAHFKALAEPESALGLTVPAQTSPENLLRLINIAGTQLKTNDLVTFNFYYDPIRLHPIRFGINWPNPDSTEIHRVDLSPRVYYLPSKNAAVWSQTYTPYDIRCYNGNNRLVLADPKNDNTPHPSSQRAFELNKKIREEDQMLGILEGFAQVFPLSSNPNH